MGIILTTKTETTTGIELPDIYINIAEIYINKISGTIQISAVAFANKKARTDKKEPIKLNEIGTMQAIVSDDLDPNTDKLNDLAYKILKAKLIDLELTSKDDI